MSVRASLLLPCALLAPAGGVDTRLNERPPSSEFFMLRPRYCFCILCAALAAALAILAASLAPATRAAGPAGKGPPAPAKKGPVSFINDIAPILKENCFGCHGAKNPKGKLNMTHYESLRKGGTKDDPIADGKPEDSYIIDVLTAPTTDKKHMPPVDNGDPLPKDQIDLIARWIKEGARLDAVIKKDADLIKELRIRWQPPAPHTSYPFPVTITSLAFTPDGKKLVVSGHHELTFWDPTTGKLEKRIRTRARRALAMLFLPDGKLAVAGGRPGEQGDVSVYDPGAGKPVGRRHLPRRGQRPGRPGQAAAAGHRRRGAVPGPVGRRQEARLGGLRPARSRLGPFGRTKRRQGPGPHREPRRLGLRGGLFARRQGRLLGGGGQPDPGLLDGRGQPGQADSRRRRALQARAEAGAGAEEASAGHL
jgi:mono/diheme cytochrome c family protein